MIMQTLALSAQLAQAASFHPSIRDLSMHILIAGAATENVMVSDV